MASQGFDVTLVANPGPDLAEAEAREGVRVIPVPMAREIDAVGDLRSLVYLAGVFRSLRPDIVIAGTPKAGLLGMVAARRCYVPVRIHHLRGLRLETTRGGLRLVLRAADWLASAAGSDVLAVSRSLADRYVAEGLSPADKIHVLGGGSSNGVQASRFVPADAEARRAARMRFYLPEDAFVIGFVGRLTRDKGVADLLSAFRTVRATRPEAWLLVAGDPENGDPVDPGVLEALRTESGICHLGFVSDSVACYAAMDMLAFPSYREGFPNAPLEAASAGVPTVGYRATGTVDAVEDAVTGDLVEVGDIAGLARGIARYADEPGLKQRRGAAARQRALKLYDREFVWGNLLDFLVARLASHGLPRPQPQRVGE